MPVGRKGRSRWVARLVRLAWPVGLAFASAAPTWPSPGGNVGAHDVTTDAGPLYEAYNQLHALSQQLRVPIDSPTVVVCGRQTDGKSALIEALMGFQFNHVGGGTKTRRPIALQMQYHPEREMPACYLHTEDGEVPLSLADLQAHIERENLALERLGTFAAEEIVVRIEYKYCPNLSIVDTPGLLSTAGEGAAGGGEGASSAARVESLVLAKLDQPAALILCVEETNNWEVAAARAVVGRADPSLARTVVVSTKLDTKFAQFGAPAELRQFLDAPTLHRRHHALLGGPFFTSVPAGRVGRSTGHMFGSNAAFQAALTQQEAADTQYIAAVLPGHEVTGAEGVPVVGVSRLRAFLERQLRERYLRNLRNVVPQLQHADGELANELADLDEAVAQMSALNAGQAIRDAVVRFASLLDECLKGSTTAAARALGQKLATEQAESGARFTSGDSLGPGVADAERMLFGGAQYYRAIAEFKAAAISLPVVDVPPEDVTNAMGVAVDAALYGRAASAIALQRAVEQMRPLVDALFARVEYILGRMLLYVKDAFDPADAAPALPEERSRPAGRPSSPAEGDDEDATDAAIGGGAAATDDGSGVAASPRWPPGERRASGALERLLGHRLWGRLAAGYHEHIAACIQQCAATCHEELSDHLGQLALLGCGPPLRAPTPWAVSMPPLPPRGGKDTRRQPDRPAPLPDVEAAEASTREELERTVEAWRMEMVRGLTRKVHAHLVLGMLDGLPSTLAQRTEALLSDGADGLDLAAARTELQGRREDVLRERTRVSRMLLTFQRVARVYATPNPS